MPKATPGKKKPAPKATFKSVCYDELITPLCNVPIQDFQFAAEVRDVQRAFDPKGDKVLTKRQKAALKVFFKTLITMASRR